MKAVIISSGDGTKLRPVTCSIPHCMLPIMGKPVIEHTARLLLRHGIKNIVISPGYLSEEVKKHFAINKLKNADISLSDTENLRCYTDDDVIFISDSILCDVDFSEFISVFNHSGSDAAIITRYSHEPYRYGCVTVGKESFVSSYTACPDFTKPCGIPFSGIVAVKKTDELPECKTLQSLLEKLTESGKIIYSYTSDCYIRDISDFDSYHRICRDFMDKKIKLPFPCEEKAPSVWIDENATVMQGALITPPVYIGAGSFISKGARIDSYTQIQNNVTVDCRAGIKRSIIMENSHIGENASLRGTVIGKNCNIGYESAVYEGSVLGFGTKTGRHCTIRTSVHIWPDKFLEDECCVSENIVWEDTQRPFSVLESGAKGILNTEITPEFALQLARSVTSVLGKKIAVSCDGDGACSMIKNALTAGIQSGGGKVYDMGEQPLPITRSAVRFYSLDGGISLSACTSDTSIYGFIDIIDSNGAAPDSDTLYALNRTLADYSSHRAPACNISEPEYLFEYKLFYLKQLINSTSKKVLGAKILIHSPSVWATELLKSAATDLRCSFDFSRSTDITSFQKEVSIGNYHLGAFCDARCETLTLVTDSGKILSEYDYLALTSLIIMKQFKNAVIYVPESAPESIEILAEKYGASVHRTRISPPHLMKELSKNRHKQFLHQFIYRFDAVGTIIILLDYLYTNAVTLDGLLSEIPPRQIITSTVSCPAEKQQEAMEKLYRNHSAQVPLTANAVKLKFKNGWVIVVPQRETSSIKVISHALSTEYAQEIADICIDEISE